MVRIPPKTPFPPSSLAAQQPAAKPPVEQTALAPGEASPADPRVVGETHSSSAQHAPQPGARAQIDLASWRPDELKGKLLADLQRGMRVLKQMPPAVTFFGGARIKRDDPYYEVSKEIGRMMAASGIPPRTGAGPGIMSSVPEGFLEGRALPDAPDDAVHFHPVLEGFSAEAAQDDTRTQGFNILLPHEQGLNPAIELAEEIELFPYRKLALYENARGIVTFPGGYGTLDELFEIWAMAARGRHDDPMAVFGTSFWQPMLDTIRKVAVEDRQLIPADVFDSMHVTDSPRDLLEHLAADDDVRGFEGDPDEIAARMSAEIAEAIDTLDALPAAVTFIGGRGLTDDDPTALAARDAAQKLTEAGVPLRVGGDGTIARAVASGARAADDDALVQGFLVRRDREGPLPQGVFAHQQVDELITHKELLGRRTKALVALPGGLGTLDELFTLLCQVQCKKRPPMPIVLVGTDFWQPIFDSIKQQMLSGERKTISPEDLDLVTITDDPAAALAELGAA